MRDLTSMGNRMGNMRDLSKTDRFGHIPSAGNQYYYVGAIYNGRPVVLGRFYSYDQADSEGKRKLPIPFQIFAYSTGDMTEATKKVKYALLHGDNVDVVTRRAKHIIDAEDNAI